MIILLIMLLIASPSMAVEPDEILADPALEARARAISRDVRCLVCEGEIIDESDAPFARDMRRAIRQKIMAGKSDSDIYLWMASIYGEGIFLHSASSINNLFLWLAPLLFAAIGLLLFMRGRQRQ